MKSFPLFILLICLKTTSIAQITITGLTYDAESKLPVSNCNISINNINTTTDSAGLFRISIPPGKSAIQVNALGYKSLKSQLFLASDTTIYISLQFSPFITEEIVVNSIRASADMPISASTIDKSEISKINSGADLPYLLNQLPSVVVTSDAGNGIGYTGIRIRGTDPSRINVTINGIPVNDAESHNMYWVDLPDIASSVENIQIQRGAGTSTNGASSFGGSVNIKTLSAAEQPFASASSSYGSFNTFKNTIQFGTGRIQDKWSLDGRLSKITSEGYIDRGSSDLKSFFISGGYTGNKTIVRLQVFSGKEITYQSWNGVPESRLNNDYQGMLDYIGRNFTTEEEANNLLNSGRNYNYYTYKNQVDDYQQDHYQLHLSHALNENLSCNLSLHYTYGNGFYEEYKNNESLSSYGLSDVIVVNDTITQTDLIRGKWLKNDFYGFTFSINYTPAPAHEFILGGAANQYDGKHFHELIWMEYAQNNLPGTRYYEDDAIKSDQNIFLKYNWKINSKVSFFTDHQIRNIRYKFNGLVDINSDLIRQNESLTFYNPKAGISIIHNNKLNSYIYIGVANKEPNRSDFTESSLASRPSPEKLIDYEAGVTYKNKLFSSAINLFYMNYHDQLVLTGAVNDVGNYTRTNTKQSFRRGIELSTSFLPLKELIIGGNITLSENQIKSFSEFIPDYDNGGEIQFNYSNTDIAFSPSLIAATYLQWKIAYSLELMINGKYIGKQYLDNTSSESRIIKPYETVDAGIIYTMKPAFMKDINFSFFVNNLLDKKYVSNGYTYAYSYGSLIRENMYYPQAGINFITKLSLTF